MWPAIGPRSSGNQRTFPLAIDNGTFREQGSILDRNCGLLCRSQNATQALGGRGWNPFN